MESENNEVIRLKGQGYVIIALIFALIVAIFAVINGEAVTVDYLFGTGEIPLILVILISVLMGGLITGGFGIFRLIKIQKELHQLRQENQRLQENQQINVQDQTDEPEEQTDSDILTNETIKE